jgi:hypothetical protein
MFAPRAAAPPSSGTTITLPPASGEPSMSVTRPDKRAIGTIWS